MKKNDHIFPSEHFKEVVRRYEQSVKENHPDYFDVDELEVVIEHYSSKKKFKNALGVIAFGLKLHPGSIDLETKHAAILMEMGEKEKAMGLINSQLLIEPDNIDLLFLKGELFLFLEKKEEAKLLFEQIAENENAISDICLDIAAIYIEKMDFETAIDFLEKGLAVSGSIEMQFELAFCYEQIGNRNAALRIYNEILDENPYSSEAWFNTGQLLFLEEEYEKAAEAYDFAHIAGNNDHGSLLLKAHALFQFESYQKALETYLEYAEAIAYTSYSFVFIGECYEKMEDFESAKKVYWEALVKDPDNPDAWTGLCICSMEQEQFVESLTYIREALRIDKNVSEYWIYMAEAYVNLNQNEEALSCYLHSLTICPEQIDTFVAIGNLYLDSDNYAKALEYYEKAAAVLSDDEEAEGLSLLFAITYFKMDEIEKAFPFFVDAVTKEEKSRELFFEFCPEATAYSIFYEL